MEKTVDYYMKLPYTIELQQDPEEGWFARVKELRGCMSQGDTAEEAVAMIQEAMELWLEVSLEDGLPIPEPRSDEDYSGKFVVRVPRSLHRELVEEAAQQGTSLNQYINVALARSVGRPAPASPAADEATGWPGLKAAVRQVLVAAGLTEEAGELDERLLGDHVERMLANTESAVQSNDFQGALWATGTIVHTLRPAASKSPLLNAFLRTMSLLRKQIETAARLCYEKSVMEEVLRHSRITDAVQSSALALAVTRAGSASYSRASTGLPEEVSREEPTEQLFSRASQIGEW
jgi:antitoxin HicB